MVDAGSDFAVPFYSGQTNVAVGTLSTPIHVAALVVQIGRGHWLLQESLYPGFPFSIHQLGIQNDAARGEACPLSLQVRIHDTQCVAEPCLHRAGGSDSLMRLAMASTAESSAAH